MTLSTIDLKPKSAPISSCSKPIIFQHKLIERFWTTEGFGTAWAVVKFYCLQWDTTSWKSNSYSSGLASSTSLVESETPASSVFTTPALSINIISGPPIGLCRTPLGTTKSSPCPSITSSLPFSPSISMVKVPLRMWKNSSGSGCECHTKPSLVRATLMSHSALRIAMSLGNRLW